MRKKRRTALTLLTALALAITMISCAPSTAPSAPDSTAPAPDVPLSSTSGSVAAGQAVTLDFPSWQATEPGFADFWKYLIDEFSTIHPEVTVNLYQVPFSGYVDTLLTRFSANSPPQICHIPAANFNAFYREGWFENLDSRLNETDMPETWTPLQSSMKGTDGANYGLLLMGYGQVLFYNEKLLQEAGVGVPTTQEEFLDACRKITKDTDGDENIDQFGYAHCSTTSPSIMAGLAPFITGNGTTLAKGKELNFSDPLVVEGMNAYKTLYTEKLMPLGLTVEQARTYFIDGKAGMVIDGPYFYANLKDAPADVVPYLKVARPPSKVVTGSPSNSVHIPASLDDATKDLVWEFYSLIIADEGQSKYAEFTGSPPPKSGVMTPELIAKQPQLELFAQMAAEAVEHRPEAYIPVYTEFTKIVVDGVMAFVTDPNMTAEQALSDIEAAVKRDITLP